MTQLSTLPMIVAGVILCIEHGGGLYWTVPGVAFSFVASVFDGWVLLPW
jgi:hypothetical protein